MCGISGIFHYTDSQPNLVSGKTIFRMTDILQHRGPDDYGYLFLESKDKKKLMRTREWQRAEINGNNFDLAFGHRRLAVIDLSEKASQPMCNEDETLWVIANCEIYNFRELREILTKKGHRFKSSSDTETILHSYEEWGEEFVRYLRGMFAFALWDASREVLLLVRDRLGKKPLVYSDWKGHFIFASEPKAILEVPDFPHKLDPEGIVHFFSYRNTPWPYTLFKGIRRLPPGCKLIFEKGKKTIERYWQISFEHKRSGNVQDLERELSEILNEAVRLRLYSEVPLGALISGGVDSSAVVAMMSNHLQHPIRTFSVGYEDANERDPEFRYSRQVSQLFSTYHHEVVVKKDSMTVLPRVIWHYDEPFAFPVALANYQLCKMMKKEVTVALSGDGADEIFAGYLGYRNWKILSNISQFLDFPSLNRIFKPLASLFHHPSLKGVGDILRILVAENHQKRALRQSLSFARLHRELFSEDFYRKTKDINVGGILEGIYRDIDPPNLLDGVLYQDLILTDAHATCTFSDISGMANGLEIRAPFMDHKIVEFAASLPIEMKIKGLDRRKYIVKKMMADTLPQSIMYRKKIGYGDAIPYWKWFWEDIQKGISDTILKSKMHENEIFNKTFIENILNRYHGGEDRFFNLLWSIYCFALWYEIYFV
jgi:asparagine synthase (glutamine-hydrolysing)